MLYISRILTNDNDIGGKRPTSINLQENVDLTTPIAFDYPKQLLYNIQAEYIVQFPLFGTSERKIYFMGDVITDMTFDPILCVFVLLTNRRQLKILSKLTNFQYVVYEDVVGKISFVTSTNSFCSCNLLELPQCYTTNLNILQAFVDMERSMVLLLTNDNNLVIQKFDAVPTTIQSSVDIPDVSHFTVYDHHLYFLSGGQLVNRNLDTDVQKVLLRSPFNFNNIVFHRVALQHHTKLCQDLQCQFMCCPHPETIVKCGCPLNMIGSDNLCECPKENPDCLSFIIHNLGSLCVGFFCRNSKCILNDLKCNGIDDCGDNSDELDCTKCPIQKYLCHGECISLGIACEGQDDQDPSNEKESKLQRASIASGFIVLIVCMSLFVVISVVLLIVYVVRRMRNSIIKRPFQLIIRSDSVGIELPYTGSIEHTETEEQN
ncbi:Low-density lipoprotein receptor-related protein 5 [Thelohanellus kitauei]|uniref:Low-density lipoprotein receptor-related protein 5 n=1 Tax=Thelohanellus kitauei TaxID=669202 RepID=A0A0C2N3B7_THEKT|nr:Low-density lipoprotein receptor-related protein 5 [Thelohanellus kitauei]